VWSGRTFFEFGKVEKDVSDLIRTDIINPGREQLLKDFVAMCDLNTKTATSTINERHIQPPVWFDMYVNKQLV
jgi:hypothetical protein